jgi:hypothetical protein
MAMSSQAPPPAFDAYMALAEFQFLDGPKFGLPFVDWLASKEYTAEQKEEIRRAYVNSGGPGAAIVLAVSSV